MYASSTSVVSILNTHLHLKGRAIPTNLLTSTNEPIEVDKKNIHNSLLRRNYFVVLTIFYWGVIEILSFWEDKDMAHIQIMFAVKR